MSSETRSPEELEELMSNAYEEYLYDKSDMSLALTFYSTMIALSDENNSVKEFVRRKELITIITELDFTGQYNQSGFEDIRNNI